MQIDSNEFRKVTTLLLNTGSVRFNVFDGTIRKVGYLVPVDYFFKDLIDIVTFEEFFLKVENDVPDIREAHTGDYDFERALYVDIYAYDSYYEATLDLWFSDLPLAMRVADTMDVEHESIYNISEGCYIYDNEED